VAHAIRDLFAERLRPFRFRQKFVDRFHASEHSHKKTFGR
jgi:hypothetical protein